MPLSSLLTVLLYLVLASLALGRYPLGVHFGPSQITAAYITRESKANVVASFAGDERYEALIQDSMSSEGLKIQQFGQWLIRDGKSLLPVPPDPPVNPEAEDTIPTLLQVIREKIDAKMKRSIDITSISVPQHFNESTSGAVTNAALQLEPGIHKPWQVRRYYNALRLAYHLNSCEGFGMMSSCHIENGPHFIFFIDYNDSYLELCVADVSEFIFTQIAKATFRDLGARSLAVPSTIAKSYWSNVRNKLQAFIDGHLWVLQGEHRAIDDLRAIVFGGDAPSQTLQVIRNITVDLLPTQADKIRDGIDPLYVGAVGAAEWAKLQVLDPKILEDISVDTLFPDTSEHDEL